MSRRAFSRLVRTVAAAALIALAFYGGWAAYAQSHQWSMRRELPGFRNNVFPTDPSLIPKGYAPVSIRLWATTSQARVGNRVDVMARFDDTFEPIALDAVVLQISARFVVLLVPADDAMLFYQIQSEQIDLDLRPTIVPTPAEYEFPVSPIAPQS